MRPKLYMSQTLQTTKKNFEKLLVSQILKTTIGIRVNLLEVFPFVPFLYSLCYLYLLFMFCGEVIFLFLSEFGGGSQCLKCVKFRDTAPFSVLL